MAAAPLIHPVTLIRDTPGYYRDEYHRLWMVLCLGFTSDHPIHNTPGAGITVTLWRVEECCKIPLSYYFPSVTCLPRMWQKYSYFSYSGTDSSFWIIEEHVRIGEVEQLVLQMEGQVGL
ncbi:protein TCL1B2-like isoform X2 [Mesocricetus auratus]|uniref:Protein TCL1B2-like isoform X2 n=1 Tax=Mesocricetus auratus TaxID=10036 RepID=A0ABM2X6J1_MESAU|nr:protein TCL1B2-like isoform X2 [Mesocricetus auratus]